MDELNQAVILYLRSLARSGASASQLLRALASKLAPEDTHKLTLIKYMRESFGLTLQEASPIAGWSPDGTGELGDADLDAFVGPDIRRHRPEWDRVEAR
jgi:hypothetical protein